MIVFKDNEVGDEGASKISEGLIINSTLTELNIGCIDGWMNSLRDKYSSCLNR